MTQYLLTVHGPAEPDEFGSYGSREEMEEAMAATDAFNQKLQSEGYWVFAGGFWIIEAPDLDVALSLAAEGSSACHGKVEVRPFQGMG